MPPVGFELTISADERSQTHPLDRAATGTGVLKLRFNNFTEDKAHKIQNIKIFKLKFKNLNPNNY